MPPLAAAAEALATPEPAAPDPAPARPGLVFGTLRIREEDLAEIDLDSGRPLVSIQREQIASVELTRGIPGERPLFELILGVLLIGWGLVVLGEIALWMVRGGTLSGTLVLSGGTLVLGAYVLWQAFRPRQLLRVRLVGGGRRKLVLRRAQGPAMLREIPRALAERGYSVVEIDPAEPGARA